MGCEASAGSLWGGEEDLARRAADLAAKLPEALAPLARIAYNYRWAWYPRGKEVLFRDIDPVLAADGTRIREWTREITYLDHANRGCPRVPEPFQ